MQQTERLSRSIIHRHRRNDPSRGQRRDLYPERILQPANGERTEPRESLVRWFCHAVRYTEQVRGGTANRALRLWRPGGTAALSITRQKADRPGGKRHEQENGQHYYVADLVGLIKVHGRSLSGVSPEVSVTARSTLSMPAPKGVASSLSA